MWTVTYNVTGQDENIPLPNLPLAGSPNKYVHFLFSLHCTLPAYALQKCPLGKRPVRWYHLPLGDRNRLGTDEISRLRYLAGGTAYKVYVRLLHSTLFAVPLCSHKRLDDYLKALSHLCIGNSPAKLTHGRRMDTLLCPASTNYGLFCHNMALGICPSLSASLHRESRFPQPSFSNDRKSVTYREVYFDISRIVK